MNKVSDTLIQLFKDREIENNCISFFEPINKVNDDWIVMLCEDSKIGINTIKNIISDMERENVKNAIVLYHNSITVFAKNMISTVQDKKIEFFLYSEFMYNVTRHELVPKHILLSQLERANILKQYSLNEKTKLKFPHIMRSDPVCRYFNAKPGQMFKIIRDSNVTKKSITYRIVV